MSKIDYQALRAKAEKATCGEWSLEYGEGRFDGDDALIHREAAGYIPICRIKGAHPESGFDEDFQMEQQANAEFIAEANPDTVLALLDEIKRLEDTNIDAMCRIAELETNLAALAEENSWLKMLIEDHASCTAVCPNCSHEEPSETDDIVWSYRSRETPATDAFLAEVRAQGLEMFAQKCNSKSEQSLASDIRDNWKLLGEHATDFAAELRKGE